MRATDPQARSEPLAADRDGQHRDRSADRVRAGDEDDAKRDLATRSKGGHGCKDGAGAGNEHETDAQTDDEPVGVLTDTPSGEKEEWPLQNPCDALR